jgi:hypothetical protein
MLELVGYDPDDAFMPVSQYQALLQDLEHTGLPADLSANCTRIAILHTTCRIGVTGGECVHF